MKKNMKKALGVGDDKGRYELPADRGTGARFVILIAGLMTFLAALALMGAFTLSNATTRWSAGLADKMTVEIPATDAQSAVRAHAEVTAATNQIASLLGQYPGIGDVHVLSDPEIAALVKPWLGDDLPWAELPVPGLITFQITVKNFDADILQKRVASIDPRARLDAHADWLQDVLRLSHALQMAAWLFLVVIGLITAAAISGAVQARLAVNRQDVEILHMMGAADRYIARQFQRQITVRVLQGSLAGLLIGVATAACIAYILHHLMPDTLTAPVFSILPYIALVILPFIIVTIAALTTQRTVYKNLSTLS